LRKHVSLEQRIVPYMKKCCWARACRQNPGNKKDQEWNPST